MGGWGRRRRSRRAPRSAGALNIFGELTRSCCDGVDECAGIGPHPPRPDIRTAGSKPGYRADLKVERPQGIVAVGSLDATGPRKGLRPPSSQTSRVKRSSFSPTCGPRAFVKGVRHDPLRRAFPQTQPSAVAQPGERPAPCAPGWRTGCHPPDRRISSAIFRLVSGRNRRGGDDPGRRSTRDCAGVGL